jgi:hypothetical protein
MKYKMKQAYRNHRVWILSELIINKINIHLMNFVIRSLGMNLWFVSQVTIYYEES